MEDEDSVFGGHNRSKGGDSDSDADEAVFRRSGSGNKSSDSSDDSDDSKGDGDDRPPSSTRQEAEHDADSDGADGLKLLMEEGEDEDDGAKSASPSRSASPKGEPKPDEAMDAKEEALPEPPGGNGVKEDPLKVRLAELELELARATGQLAARKGWRVGQYLDPKKYLKQLEEKKAAKEAEAKRHAEEEQRRKERRKRREEEEEREKEKERERLKRKRATIDSDDDERPSTPPKESKKEEEKPKEPEKPLKPLPVLADLSAKILAQCNDGLKAYLEGLFTDTSYDVNKHTSFFCTPCNELMTSTSLWEEHFATSYHVKTVAQWRFCAALRAAAKSGQVAKAQAEISDWTELLVGSEEAVEVGTSEGKTRHWVCTLCVVDFHESEQIVGHLGTLSHIDKYLERMKPELVQPPRKNDEIEDNIALIENTPTEKKVRECGNMTMSGLGRGKMRTYHGEEFLEWPDEADEATAEAETQRVKEHMEKLFSVPGGVAPDFSVPYVTEKNVLKMSVANCDYEELALNDSCPVLGLQYVVELWAPTRRAVPLYYCTLCDVTTASWEEHCSLTKHAVLYMSLHYATVVDVLLKDASTEEGFRSIFTLARQKVLMLEGRMGRVAWVLQQKAATDRIFVPFNRDVARKLAVDARVEIPDPPKRPKSKKSIRRPAAKEDDAPKQDFSGFGVAYAKAPPGSAPQPPVSRSSGQPFGNKGVYSEFRASDPRGGVDFSSMGRDDDPVIVPQGAVGVPDNFKATGSATSAAASGASTVLPDGPAQRRTNFDALASGHVSRLNELLSKAGVAEYVSNVHDFENLRRSLGDSAFESFMSKCRE